MMALIGILAQTMACISSSSLQGHQWIPGDYTVLPVTHPVPAGLTLREDASPFRVLTRPEAASLVSGKLPNTKYYYLTNVLFFGKEGNVSRLPERVESYFSVDVDEVAYVFSGTLGTMKEISRAPIVLSSNVPVKQVKFVCDGAI
jgi:hypothetical protein